MGIYLYTLRKPNPRRTPEGPVYRYKFSENMEHYSREGAQLARAERHRDRWHGYTRVNWVTKKAEIETPLLFTIDGDEGAEVYRQEDDLKPVWYDCDEIPGTFVGYLAKDGRKWTIVTLDAKLMLDRLFLQGYLTTHGLWDRVPEDLGRVLADQVHVYREVAYAHWKVPHTVMESLHVPSEGTSARKVFDALDATHYHVARARRAAKEAAA
jgi:hypothetical protein